MKIKIILLLFLLIINIIFSQQKTDKIILVADEQIFDMQKNILLAYGKVKINYRNYLIRGEEARYDKEKNEMKVKGNATFSQNEMSLLAEEIVVDLAGEKITAKGKVNFTEPDKKIHILAEELFIQLKEKERIIIAKNKVKIKKEDMEGESDLVEMYPDEDKAKLVGKAHVRINTSSISANILTISFSDKKIKAEGEATVVAYPESEKNNAKDQRPNKNIR